MYHFEIPDLEETEESILAQMRAVNKALLSGLDPKVADVLIKGARVALSSIRQRKENAKIETLRSMIKDVTEALRDAADYEAQVRTHRLNPPLAVTIANKREPASS